MLACLQVYQNPLFVVTLSELVEKLIKLTKRNGRSSKSQAYFS